MIYLRSLVLAVLASNLLIATIDAQQPRVRSPWLLPNSKDFPVKPDLSGCYILVRRDSRREAPWPSTLPFAYAPARLQIQISNSGISSLQYEAATGPGGIQGPSLRRPLLQRPHPDSIVINFHGGFHGVSLRLRYRPKEWDGRIHEISDTNADGQLLGYVVARRVDCMVWLGEFRDFRRTRNF